MYKRSPPAQPDFYVGSIPIYGDLVLSPMAGFSDLPFRSLCRELGSAMSYTEFVNAMDIVQKHPYVEKRLAFLPEERPLVFQIFDNEPTRLLEAALQLQEQCPDVIDINMGCSVRRVAGRGAGAGLLKTPVKVARIFRLLTRALEVPVTGKIRLGWDENSRNYALIARIVEENGGALLAVHGRTRMQGYSGHADWDAIAELKTTLSIPVIGNGDVKTSADIKRFKNYSGCDGIMIGRAAIGNPWIFSHLDREQVSPELVRQVLDRHLERMLDFYGQQLGLVRFRKHAVRYLSPYNLPRDRRLRLLTTERVDEFGDVLDELMSEEIEPKAT